MKFLVIGRGSMGQRRTKHLQELGHEVVGWDIKDETPMPIIQDCDGVIISTPPANHEDYFCNISLPTFVEASVLSYKPRGNLFPSCTTRFHPQVEYLRKHMKNTKPLAYIYHVGNLISDWHPNQDYRKQYFAKWETGGAKEIVCYELCWLTDVFGAIETSFILGSKISQLQMGADDHFHGLIQHNSGVRGTLVVDVLSKPRVRNFELIYEGNNEHYDMDKVNWEDCYRREIKAWVDTFNGGSWPYSVEEDLDIVNQLVIDEDEPI